MKRYIEISGDIIYEKYDSETWELLIQVIPKDLTALLIELQLLIYEKVDTVTIKSLRTSKYIIFSINNTSKYPKIDFINNRYSIVLSSVASGAILSFLLEFYRDSYAPVSHIHIDLEESKSRSKNGALTFITNKIQKPVNGERARKLL